VALSLVTVALTTVALQPPAALAQAPAVPPPPAAAKPGDAAAAPLFAKVGSTAISAAEYDVAYSQAQRQRFYHRKAPEHEVQALRREVGDQLINRVLLLEEAARRGVQPDRAKIDAAVAGYEKQYGNSPQWPRIKSEMLPSLVAELERQSAVERLEESVRESAAPTEAQLKEFYAKNQGLFTEPPKQRVSLILLKVDPSSSQEVWNKALEEGKAVYARIAKGADFAEQARLHSGDESGPKGGDMGFMHRGAISEDIAQKLDKLALGEVSEPLQILEGVALFRVMERIAPQLHPLDKVRTRAEGLWKREQGEQAWQALIARLRSGASITIADPSRYPDLAATVAPAQPR
jgi:parvulin-like peptidyl-prolyl isomerase